LIDGGRERRTAYAPLDEAGKKIILDTALVFLVF
jgi:hypothetical protein